MGIRRPGRLVVRAPHLSVGGGADMRARAREPIFCETRTIEFCGIRKSAPQPAGPCEPLHPGRWVCEREGVASSCGGDVEARALAPLRGSLRRPLLVPFHTSPPSRGALRSAGVPTIAASTTPAPSLAAGASAPGRCEGIWEDPAWRKGVPHVRRGVGSVGAWRLAIPSTKPPGVPAGWGRLQG